jgi:hypothetical protein
MRHRRLFCGRRMQCDKNDGGLPHDFQALGQQGSVAVVQVDIVGGSGAHFHTNGFTHHKRDGLGLGFPRSPIRRLRRPPNGSRKRKSSIANYEKRGKGWWRNVF